MGYARQYVGRSYRNTRHVKGPKIPHLTWPLTNLSPARTSRAQSDTELWGALGQCESRIVENSDYIIVSRSILNIRTVHSRNYDVRYIEKTANYDMFSIYLVILLIFKNLRYIDILLYRCYIISQSILITRVYCIRITLTVRTTT